MDMDTIDYHWQNVLRPYKGSFVFYYAVLLKNQKIHEFYTFYSNL